MSRRWLRWVFVGLVALIAGLGARRVLHARRLDREAALAAEEFAEGRFESAGNRLRRVARERPEDEGVAYDLGLCEERLGDRDAAIATWSRVAPGTPLGARAAVAIGRARLAQGRYAEGERALAAARGRPGSGPEAAMVLEMLVVYYRTEGRTGEIRPLLGRVWDLATRADDDPGWEGVSRPRDLLRQYAVVDLEPIAAEGLRRTLAEAERLAPDDDRVALGLANLETAEGRYDEADRRLLACESRRPGDRAVARARLDRALAAGDETQARSALGLLPDDALGPAEVLGLRAWFARRREDGAAERTALEEILAREPAHAPALDRLAELAGLDGDEGRARALRERKAELDAIRGRYRAEYYRADVATRAAELAGWAEALGRRFEARAWWTLLARARPGDRAARENLARLARLPSPPPGPRLAGLRAELAGRAEVAESPPPADPGEFHFVDEAAAAGLRFTYDSGRTPGRQLPETMGGGVGLLDYDGDGWLDVYCVQGGPLVPDPALPSPGDRLFHNRGDGTFEDATEAAGLPATGRGFGNGVAVGDFDGDGRPDLFVTRLEAYALLRNRGDGTFEDVTEPAGLAGPRDWPTSAAFADLDGDGDLDLYVCHYAAWDVRRPLICRRADGSPDYCRPLAVTPAADRLFRNDDGRFVDVTEEAGIADAEGRGLGLVAADLDGDGRVDLFVANDSTANYLWRNLGGIRFEEVALTAGVAANAGGGYQAGMGVACGDLDGDGRPDLAVTNFFGESTSLFANLGGGLFADRTAEAGLRGATRHLLGFGAAFLDADNDGHLDLLTVNGHVSDYRPDFPHEMPPQLLAGDGLGRLVDVSATAGPTFRAPALGRGLAVGDLDNDGRPDALAVNLDKSLAYLHNLGRGGHWVRFTLEGAGSNRDGVGAVVTVHSDGRRQAAARIGGGSYQSTSDRRLHFGLGEAGRVDRVEVAWPSGRVDRFANLDADADYRIREGASAPVRWGPSAR